MARIWMCAEGEETARPSVWFVACPVRKSGATSFRVSGSLRFMSNSPTSDRLVALQTLAEEVGVVPAEHLNEIVAHLVRHTKAVLDWDPQGPLPEPPEEIFAHSAPLQRTPATAAKQGRAGSEETAALAAYEEAIAARGAGAVPSYHRKGRSDAEPAGRAHAPPEDTTAWGVASGTYSPLAAPATAAAAAAASAARADPTIIGSAERHAELALLELCGGRPKSLDDALAAEGDGATAGATCGYPPVTDEGAKRQRHGPPPGIRGSSFMGVTWTADEDRMLLALIKEHSDSAGKPQWGTIGAKLPGRKPQEARCRFRRMRQRLAANEQAGNVCTKCGQTRRGHSCPGVLPGFKPGKSKAKRPAPTLEARARQRATAASTGGGRAVGSVHGGGQAGGGEGGLFDEMGGEPGGELGEEEEEEEEYNEEGGEAMEDAARLGDDSCRSRESGHDMFRDREQRHMEEEIKQYERRQEEAQKRKREQPQQKPQKRQKPPKQHCKLPPPRVVLKSSAFSRDGASRGDGPLPPGVVRPPSPSAPPAEAAAAPDEPEDASMCWAGTLKGAEERKLRPCDPCFVRGRGHMKNKVCELCNGKRGNLVLPASRVRALPPALHEVLSNQSDAGVWSRAPLVFGGGRIRVVNNTATCKAPRLIVFEGEPPDFQWLPLPGGWVNEFGEVHLFVGHGTLCPAVFNAKPPARNKPSVEALAAAFAVGADPAAADEMTRLYEQQQREEREEARAKQQQREQATKAAAAQAAATPQATKPSDAAASLPALPPLSAVPMAPAVQQAQIHGGTMRPPPQPPPQQQQLLPPQQQQPNAGSGALKHTSTSRVAPAAQVAATATVTRGDDGKLYVHPPQMQPPPPPPLPQPPLQQPPVQPPALAPPAAPAPAAPPPMQQPPPVTEDDGSGVESGWTTGVESGWNSSSGDEYAALLSPPPPQPARSLNAPSLV